VLGGVVLGGVVLGGVVRGGVVVDEDGTDEVERLLPDA
jgi:hypothetical protein